MKISMVTDILDREITIEEEGKSIKSLLKRIDYALKELQKLCKEDE